MKVLKSSELICAVLSEINQCKPQIACFRGTKYFLEGLNEIRKNGTEIEFKSVLIIDL